MPLMTSLVQFLRTSKSGFASLKLSKTSLLLFLTFPELPSIFCRHPTEKPFRQLDDDLHQLLPVPRQVHGHLRKGYLRSLQQSYTGARVEA